MKSVPLVLSMLVASMMVVLPGEASASPGRVRVVDSRQSEPAPTAQIIRRAPPREPVRGGRRVVPPGQGYGRRGKVLIRPGRSGDAADRFASEMFMRHVSGLDCSDLGELLRRISNDILASNQLPEIPSDEERRLPAERRRAFSLKRLLRRPAFIKTVWDRLTDAYESCDKPCFDDGVAMGVISGTGYCQASTSLDGLPDDGFVYQPPMPLCQTSNYVGCQQGYSQAVNSLRGCLTYASGSYAETFNHSVSQDCHME